MAQPGCRAIAQSSHVPKPANTCPHLNFVPRSYFTLRFLYGQCCHTNSAFIIPLIPHGIGFLSLFNEWSSHIPFSRHICNLCDCLQSAELCLLPQSWDPCLLLPISISTIIHPLLCVRKHSSETAHRTEAPKLPQLMISKMSRINYFTENKWFSQWNITSSWKGDVCALQQCEILYRAPAGICRAKFSNDRGKDTTIRVIFITAVIYELKC